MSSSVSNNPTNGLEQKGGSYAYHGAKPLSGALLLMLRSPVTKELLTKRNDEMRKYGNGLSEIDLGHVLKKLSLDIAEVDGQRIITLNGKKIRRVEGEKITFGQLKKGGRYPKDSDGNISFENLYGSYYSVQETLDDILTPVGKLFGIDKIDKTYIKHVYNKFPNEKLSEDHPLWKTLITLSAIFGGPIAFPLYENADGSVHSVNCDINDCGVLDDNYDKSDAYPASKVDSFTS